MDSAEDISNAAKGHKANLSNPSMSSYWSFAIMTSVPSSSFLKATGPCIGHLACSCFMLMGLPLLDTSEASKAHSKEVLESLGGEQAFYSKQGDDSKDPGNVERGLKAAVTNESIGESGTKQAQEKLDKM
ncbi:MAG: hypothetical protein LQ338_007714 [Usnochroma carphineum]|nr:MAG: hypothetical protein LQ338_007714 [Usnochroma carphineum]